MREDIKKRIEEVRRGEVPDGYRRTRAGLMPLEWKGNLAAKDVFRNHTNKKHNGEFEVLSATQDRGIIPRSEVDIDIKYAEENIGSYKKVEAGDFVISLRSFQGGIEYSEYEGLVSPAYTVLKATQPISDNFYRAYFKTPDFISRLNGAVYGIRDGKQIGFEDFGELAVHYPPLTEQQKIAEILAACDRMIELKKQLVDEYKKTKKIFLRRLFPTQGENVPELRFPGFKGEWRKCRLGALSDFITKGATPTTYGYQWETTGIPFFRNDSIQDNRFVYGEYSFISETAHNALSRSEVKGDDILIAITGDIGKVGIVPKDVIRGNINQHMARVRIIRDALPFFVYQYLCTATMQSNYQLIKTGISMPQLSLDQIRNTEILLPSLEEQQCIAACLKNLDEAIELHLQELEEVQRQKKTMMQLLLTGLVRVNA